jgi:hypothetical protein
MQQKQGDIKCKNHLTAIGKMPSAIRPGRIKEECLFHQDYQFKIKKNYTNK